LHIEPQIHNISEKVRYHLHVNENQIEKKSIDFRKEFAVISPRSGRYRASHLPLVPPRKHSKLKQIPKTPRDQKFKEAATQKSHRSINNSKTTSTTSSTKYISSRKLLLVSLHHTCKLDPPLRRYQNSPRPEFDNRYGGEAYRVSRTCKYVCREQGQRR